MNKQLLFASLPVAIISALIIGLLSPALAQEDTQNTRISISPVTYNLTANPGDTLRQVIKVRNDAAVTQQVSIDVQNFTAVGEEGQVGLTDEETSFSLAKWIEFEKSTFELGSGKEVQVPFLIRVPGNAEPGGHYASVFAHLGAANPGDVSGSSIGQKIASLVLLRVAGTVKEQAAVESFSVGEFEAGQSVPFDVRIRNQGSVHIRPQGFVTVNDTFGNKVADVAIDENNVLPDAVRRLEATWDKPGFMGRYTANALMYYGDANQQLTATTTFWIIPWKQLAIYGGAALLVLVVLWFGRRRIGRSLKALVSGK
jgi:hypothetical protein